MKKTIRIVVMLALSGGLLLAQNARTPEVLFKAAQNKEQVEGDLKGAIEQYKQIASGRDRVMAAKALVRMAECYLKLGDAEAQRIYERVVRDYADQTEAAAVARAHLGRTEAAATSAGMTSRRVWTPSPDADASSGAISSDGRLVFTDWETGDLAVHNFVSGRDRRLTDSQGTWDDRSKEFAEEAAISRNGKQVAYSWYNIKGDNELRVTSLEGTSLPQSRLLFANEDLRWVAPFDWSPDGNWIAVQLERQDRTRQMGLISVRDGSLRVLKSAEWQGATKLFFSPDGKYLAFDAPVGESRNDQRDVFLLAVDGSREVPAVVGPSNDTMMGWSPDGKYLLFASDRGASVGLWAAPIAEGRPQGTPELMKPEISRFSLGVSASGSLYTHVILSGRDIQVATVDFETGKLVSQPVNPAKSYMGFNQVPAWSPDGKYLAYLSYRNRIGGNRVIVIWSAETGQVREIQPRLNYFGYPLWAPDGRSWISDGRDLKNRSGVYRIDAQTGESTPIVMSEDGHTLDHTQWSPDGTRIYYRRNLATDGFSFVERDLASGNEREIIRRENPSNLFILNLSPDGRFIATTYNDRSTRSHVLLLIPVFGGEPRELFRVTQPQSLMGTASWMPDGRAVVVDKVFNDSVTEREFWLVPTAGGQPRKIDVGPTTGLGPVVRVHPDGRQIAYVVGDWTKQEVWVLENFLPALNAKK